MFVRLSLATLVLAVCCATALGATLYNLGLGTPTGAVMDGANPCVAYHNTNVAGTVGTFIWSATYGSIQIDTAGDSAGIAKQGSNLLVAGNSTAGGTGARYWLGTAAGTGSWTTLPLTDGSRAWTARCIAASSSQALIGGSYRDANNYNGACRWRQDSGSASSLELPRQTPFPLGDAYHNHSYIYGIAIPGLSSGMGTLAGQAQYTGGAPSGGARQAIGGWNVTASPNCICGFKNLNGNPDNTRESSALAAAGDGSRVVGWSYESTLVSTYRWACYWDAPHTNHGVEPVKIPMIAGSNHDYSLATAASEDGRVIAGSSLWLNDNPGSWTCWVWDAVSGTRDLRDILTDNGIDVTGWQFQSVAGVCDGGSAITGYGYLNGDRTKAYGWVVTGLPKPPANPPLGIINRATYDPIVPTARLRFPYVVWGRVLNENYSTNTLTIADGSHGGVKVFSYDGHPAYPGAYVRVEGWLTRLGPPLILSTYDDIMLVSEL